MKSVLLLAALLATAPKRPDVPAPGKLWHPLPPPRTGDWRDVYREPGQTFSEYRAAAPVRPTARRRLIYLLPLLTRPPADRAMLDELARYLGAYFGREVRRLPPRPLPRRAYRPSRRQVSVAGLVSYLRLWLPGDALLMLAVTDRDLFVGDLGFTFGWGSFAHRVAVMSTHRLGRGDDRARLRRRYLGLAAHEASHALSLRHCTFYGCLMNGARSLGDADRRPLLLCPVCARKLTWNLGVDLPDRYRKVAAALAAAGLAGEARRAARAAELMAGRTPAGSKGP